MDIGIIGAGSVAQAFARHALNVGHTIKHQQQPWAEHIRRHGAHIGLWCDGGDQRRSRGV